MKSFDLNHPSQTQDSIGAYSRAQSYQSSILIRDLNSQSFSILQQKPTFSMIGKQSNLHVLNQNSEDFYLEKLKKIEQENNNLKCKIHLLESKMREQAESNQQSIKLKEIAQSEYMCGIKNMYERNTQLSEQIIIYEKELKNSLYKICQLQRDLEESNNKSKDRMSRQLQLQNRIKGIEDKYDEKIQILEKSYEKDRESKQLKLREQRFQIQNLKQDLLKQNNLRKQVEQLYHNLVLEKQNNLPKIYTIEEQNKTLTSQIQSLKSHINTLQNQKVITRQKTKTETNCYISQDLASSTIAALAVQNITLKQQQQQSSKAILFLHGKMKTYQNQISSKSLLDKQNHRSNFRGNYRRQRFSSVDRRNTSFNENFCNAYNSQDSSFHMMSVNSAALRSKQRQSLLVERSYKRENLNEVLVKKCRELNQSLYI